MFPVLSLYPYFSKQSQHLLFETFFNDNIYLAKQLNGTYYLDSKVTNDTVYYFGKFSNYSDAYKIYRNIIVVMKLLGEFTLNDKYLTININELKLLDQYIVYENDELYKPFVDKSSYTTICITFDGNKYYVQEFCNFNKTLLKTLYSDSKIINVKNQFTRRWREKNSFENTFWEFLGIL